MSNLDRKIVFAPLVRVSTERQSKKGESLSTQKADLAQDIAALGGTVYRWYEGQEHATPDYERKILRELMQDAEAKRFDAIIVHDLSRWSRDNEKSKAYIRILKDHNIRFFERTREINLFDPTQAFVLGMGIEVHEFFAGQQAYKSMINRISRARRGLPSCGKKPYGRIWHKESQTWTIDPEKQARVQEIARLYLEGNSSWEALGRKFGMNGSSLHKTMTHRCGDTWEQQFTLKSWGIHEVVATPVPRLLPEEVIQAIRAKAISRRTWDKKTQKHQYLFSRLIFDMETKRALTGTCSKGRRYYQPYQGTRYQINAKVLERVVTRELFQALSSSSNLKEVIYGGSPNGKVIQELTELKTSKESELKRVEARIENYLTMVGNCEDDVKALIDRLKPKIVELENMAKALKEEIISLTNQIETLPKDEEIERSRVTAKNDLRKILKEKIRKAVKDSYIDSGQAILDLPFEEQRKIVGMFFGGRDETGKRYGIYITNLGGSPRKYAFAACGKLGIVEGEVQARTGFSYGEPFLDHQPAECEISEIAGAIALATPGLSKGKEKDKVHMPGEGQGTNRQRRGLGGVFRLAIPGAGLS
jgi:DNA invertase Pin-like site-specific DNA recombinase